MKKIIIAALAASLLLSLASCREPSGSLINTTSAETTTKPTAETAYSAEALRAAGETAKLINENSDLYFALLTPWNSAKNNTSFKLLNGFGGAGLESADGLTVYTFSGYPDALDEWVLTDFYTYDPEHNVVGVSCGTASSDAEKKLTDAGFIRNDESTPDTQYNRDGWRVTLSVSGGVVIKIRVSFDTTNVEGVVF
jgi:hypothetical protein